MLERLFRLRAHGTTVKTEIVAGLTTFLTMAYIVFVNPDILSAAAMPRDAVFVATCLAAALGTVIMGLKNAGLVTAHPAMLPTPGDIHAPWAAAPCLPCFC